MGAESYFDRRRQQYEQPPSAPDYSAALHHLADDHSRRETQKLYKQYHLQPDVWVSGLQVSSSADTGHSEGTVLHHSIPSDLQFPDILTGKRRTSEPGLQDVLEQTADAEVSAPVFEVDWSGRVLHMEVYELPADTNQITELNGRVSESYTMTPSRVSRHNKAKRSSLVRDFGYLKSWITFDSPQPAVEDVEHHAEDMSYLSRHIIAGNVPKAPLLASSPSAVCLSPLALSPVWSTASSSAPPTLSTSTLPSPPSTPLSSPPSPLRPLLCHKTPTLSPAITLPTIIVTAPDAPPPLPPKPRLYLNLPLIAAPARQRSEVVLVTEHAIPPPLPPKPEAYIPRACCSPIDYEQCIENKYGAGSRRRRSR